VSEYGEIVDALKGIMAETFAAYGPESLWRLRSELHLLQTYLDSHGEKRADLRAAVQATLALTADAHAFHVELRSALTDKQYTQFASVLDLGAIGTLALENLLTAEKITIPRLLLNALSELLVYLASREYVKGADSRAAAALQARASPLQDEVWATLGRYRKKASSAELREAQRAIDGFFGTLATGALPAEARAALLAGTFQILLRLRCAEVLQLAARS